MPVSWVDITVDGQTMEGYLAQPAASGVRRSSSVNVSPPFIFPAAGAVSPHWRAAEAARCNCSANR